jgi:CRISPR-associated protein Cmr1
MRKKPEITPPESLTRQPLEIIEQTRKYALMTPLYGGGVTPTEPDPITVVRATEVRGQLRFWWRATRGGRSAEDASMREREDAIWGKAYEKGDTGISSNETVQIVVDVDPARRGEAVQTFLPGRTPRPTAHVSGYAAFPLQLEQGKVWKGTHFTLTMTYPTRWSAEIEAALWAWETFGGLGARTRRGFGALHLLEINGESARSLPTSRGIETWIREQARHHIQEGQFPAGVPHLSPEIAVVVTGLNRDPVEAWKNLIKKLQEFRQQKDMSNRSAWPEADAIRAIARTGPTADIPKFPRAAFGLPVIFHFTGQNAPAGNYTLNEADTQRGPEQGNAHPHKERFASPLILRPFQCSDGMSVGLALLLEGSRVDLNHLVVQDERKRSQPVEGTLTTQEARTITRKIPDLKNETDVLHAFLTFLKRG